MFSLFNIFRVLAAAAIAVGAIIAPAAAQSGAREDQVKAAFVYNFIKFVEWPPEIWGAADTPIKLCVSEGGALNGALAALRGKMARNRLIQVLQGLKKPDRSGCHVLFVGPDDRHALSKISRGTIGRGLLTVSDIDGFAERGGVIGLFVSEGRVRFAINAGAAHRSGLRVSSQLLKLGRIVETERQR